jgi:glycosyltransferase involved in cell wall biosynthesis
VEVAHGTDPSGRRLRIAMVAPPWYQLPPDGYGGIEAMVFWLVEALHQRGHQVTVIGAGEPEVSGSSRTTYKEPPSERIGQPLPETVHALVAAKHLDELDADVVHDHSLAGPLTARARQVPTVVTAHGPIQDDLAAYYTHLVPGRQGGLLPVPRPGQRREGTRPGDRGGADGGPPDRARRQVHRAG